MFWFSSLISFFIPLGWYSTIYGSSEGEIMEVLPYLGFARLSPHIHSWLVMERFGINSMKKNGIEFFIKIGRLYSSPSHIDLVTQYRIIVYLSSSVIGFHSILSTRLLLLPSNFNLITIDNPLFGTLRHRFNNRIQMSKSDIWNQRNKKPKKRANVT